MERVAPKRRANRSTLILPILLGTAAIAIFAIENSRARRRPTQSEPRRLLRNLALGSLSMAAVALVERPVVDRVANGAAAQRRGLVQRLPISAALRDAVAVLLMDYTIYLWHVATHRVPVLWRFHLVHHLDLDMDSTTALRFHFTDMVISTPYRALQVFIIGTSPRALKTWQAFFFLSVLFHHSNLRLPHHLERTLAWLFTTPRMHGIHHSAVEQQTNSNWSSGFSVWDRLHGTLRLDVPDEEIEIGVPAYRRSREIGFLRSIRLPFRKHRDAWSTPPYLAAAAPL